MRLHRLVPAITLCLSALQCSCERASQAQVLTRKVLYYHDPMHPSYRSDRPGIAPDCNMALTPVFADEAPSSPARVHVNQAQATAIGLHTEAARSETGAGEVRTVGRVQALESRRFQVTAGAEGWIRKIYGGETGSFVTTGQPLASYYSRELYSPQQAYLYAQDSLKRSRGAKGVTPEQLDLAEKQVTQARDYLEFLGMTDPQITALEHSRQESREVTFGAPAAGVILERKVSEGSRITKGDVLFEIADITSVWITADVFPESIGTVSGLRSATVVLPGGAETEATIDQSLPQYEAADRVGKLRLVLSNPGRKLLPGMTVTVLFRKGLGSGLTVPAEAVIESGIKPRVFVSREDGSFEARTVTTGWRSGGRLQILSGLHAGEHVVVSGAFLIDSESRISEGLK